MIFAAYTHNASQIFRQLKNKDFLIILFLCLFIPLFFYNLGNFSLADFDESWYAEIARNIIVHKNPVLLSFNGKPYFSHPPIGFILMSLSFLFFGISEFAARFPSAILGFGSLLLLFLTGKELFNRFVGLGAALMLGTSVWYVLRARSGNLDSIFLFFYLLTFYLTLKVKENKKNLYFTAISFSVLFLTKSLIGISLFFPIIAILLLDKSHLKIGDLVKAALLFLTITAPWFICNFLISKSYFLHVFLITGFRPGSLTIPNILEINKNLTIQYLHFGIREWFYPSTIAVLGSLSFLLKRNFLILYAWFLSLFLGFITNSNVEIWHLIPLYPVLGLFISTFVYYSVDYVFSAIKYLFNNYKKYVKVIIFLQDIALITIFGCLILLGSKQVYEFRNDVNFFTKGDSNLASVSKEAAKYPQPLYLNADNLLPSAVFYSRKKVETISEKVKKGDSLTDFAQNNIEAFLVLSEKWRINKESITDQRKNLLADKGDFVLIRIDPIPGENKAH